jgi:hypothetical protein
MPLVNYPGLYPVTIAPWNGTGSFVSNYGVWPTPQEDDGSDPRTAANIFAISEALVTRTNLLGWRAAYLNPIDGSTSTFTTAINTANVWTFTHQVNVATTCIMGMFGVEAVGDGGVTPTSGSFTNQGTIYLGYPLVGNGHITISRGSDITANGALGSSGSAQILATGALAVIQCLNGAGLGTDSTSPAVFDGPTTLAGTTNQTGTIVRSGTQAATELRVTTLPNASGTFTPSHSDIWEIPVMSAASQVLTIASEATSFEFIIRQQNPATQAYDCQVEANDATGRGLFSYQSGAGGPINSGTCRYLMRGSAGLPYVESYFNGVGMGYSGPPTLTF